MADVAKTTAAHNCEAAPLFDQMKQLIARYEGRPDDLIQVLHLTQNIYGCVPLEMQKLIAETLDIPLAEVSGVVSFYSFFATEPRGKHVIRVCLGTACYVRGGKNLVDKVEELLDIRLGGTTKDGLFTFEVARCIGACSLAPAVMIDDTVYREVTPDSLPAILDTYRQ